MNSRSVHLLSARVTGSCYRTQCLCHEVQRATFFSLQVMFVCIAELGRAGGEVDADGGWLERGRVLGFCEDGGRLLDGDVDSC